MAASTVAPSTFEPRSLLTQEINAGREQERLAAAAAAGGHPSTGPDSGPPVKNSNNANIGSFRREAKVTLHEPVNSMSLSAANRDVVLGARKGLFVVDLDNLWKPPRFLAHLTTFQVADIQFNPHPAKSHWVASTSNQKLLVWNLDRPANPKPQESGRTIYSTTPTSRSLRPGTVLSSHTAISGGSSLHELNPSPSVTRGSAVEHILHAHTRAITDINWHSMFPSVLASCGLDAWTWVWDLRTPPTKPVQGYSAWNAPCTQIKWNRATPYRLATACDNKVLIWDERKGALPLCTIEAHESRIYGIDWSRHEVLGHDRMVTCSLDRTVKFWNLELPDAQRAIAERELVTEPESTIETGTPVWRARHLPFGQGVMTLPQRGSNVLSMWAKDKPEAPVTQFEGHTDVVKEYLIRTHGGENKASDDRTFQLITWSKDQTLRLWPITDKETEAVGHRPGAPIQVLHTRINAVNKSYRDPPSPELLSATATIASTSAMAAPVLPRSLASRGSGHSPYGSSLAGSGRSPEQGMMSGLGSRQPSSFAEYHIQQQLGSTPTGTASYSSSRHGARQQYSGGTPGAHHAFPIDGLPSVGGLTPVFLGSGKLTHGSTMSGPRDPRNRPSTVLSGADRASARRRREKEEHQRTSSSRPTANATAAGAAARRDAASSKHPKTSGYMTLAGGAGQGRYGTTRGVGGQLARGNLMGGGAKLDAAQDVAWLAQVDMSVGATGRRLSNEDGLGGGGGGTDGDAESSLAEEEADAAAEFLAQEIAQLSAKLPLVAYIEQIDLAHRSCTICLYGPWAHRRTPVYMRIHFTFPRRYPHEPAEFDLERNIAIIPKWRAKLRAHIARVTARFAEHHRGCLGPVVSFLVGQVPGHEIAAGEPEDSDEEERERIARSVPHPGFPLLDEGEDETQDEVSLTRRAMIIMPPPRCGASFGPHGELVVFAPSSSRQHLPHRFHPQAGYTTNLSRASSRSRSLHHPREARNREHSAYPPSGASAILGGVEGRFLQSYNALSAAMSSLAQRARELGGEDDGEQDSDVLQLMTTDFVQRRIHSERNEATATAAAGALISSTTRESRRVLAPLTSNRSSVHIYDVSAVLAAEEGEE